MGEAAKACFKTTLGLTTAVVEHFWQENDSGLEQWWDGIWWKHLEGAKRELTKKNLSYVMATLMTKATFFHDLAHSRWVYINDMYHVTYLRHGDMLDPRT